MINCLPPPFSKFLDPPLCSACNSRTANALNDGDDDDEFGILMSCQGLLDELTVRGVGLLYELVLVAQQGSWCDEPDSFFKISWIVNVVEQVDRHDLVGVCPLVFSYLLCKKTFFRLLE